VTSNFYNVFSMLAAEVLGIFVKVPPIQKFEEVKVLGTKVSQERKFSLWTFHSRERKWCEMKNPDTIASIKDEDGFTYSKPAA